MADDTCSSSKLDAFMPPTPCPNHYIHPYHFNELALGRGSNKQPYFRAMVFFNKKPGLTDEFFHDHWKSVHADLTMQVKGAGVDLVRYVQFHQEKKDIAAMDDLLQASGGAMQILPYDGAAEFWAESPEKFTKFMKSVYASDHLVGCGKRFVDLVGGYHVMVGYDNLILGPTVAANGYDGVLNGDPRLNASAEVTVSKEVDAAGKRDSVVTAEEMRDMATV